MDLIFDAHLDLSMNALEWNRDLRLSVQILRDREKGLVDKPDRAKGTVAFPEMREGKVGLVVATQIARYVAPGSPIPGWSSQEQAWAQTQGQLAWYRAMEEDGEMVQITNAGELGKHLVLWESPGDIKKPIGYILSLEGADSIVSMKHLEKAYESGLRAIGPAHYGLGVYANGTDSNGDLNKKGRELLCEMDRLNMILDVTHLNDDAFWDALRIYKSPLWASHQNCRELVDHNRQFNNEQIKAVIERGGVLGVALDAWMLTANWVRGKSTPESENVNLEAAVNHIDYICQLAGNSLHAGIGSDLDGAFGKEQCPYDLETIADLQKFEQLLKNRGYSTGDVENIMHGNFIRFLKKALG